MAQRISGKARRKQILEVASRMIEREGFDRITAKRLAEAAEISDTLIFRHFGTMEDLFEAICTEFIPDINELTLDTEPEDARAYLLNFSQHFIHHNITDPRPIRLLTWAQLQRPDYLRSLKDQVFESELMDKVKRHIQSLYNNPQTASRRTDLFLSGLFSSLRSYLVFRTSTVPPHPGQTAQLLLKLLEE
jgi:AcrR family transcriptional regulator